MEAKARTWLTDVLKSVGGPRPPPIFLPPVSPAREGAALSRGESGPSTGSRPGAEVRPSPDPDLQRLRTFVLRQVIPRLSQCENELQNLLDGLNGRFVPPGPAGAPTRGRIDVLPTGRNFFSIDPRAVPTQTAWHCGKAMAHQLMERHRQEQGEYPRKLALVVWGTSNMRTGGDDIAQALCLWGCEPVWEEVSGRVVDFRILPLSLLGRPRVDVLLRVSGMFRDAFGETMRLLATVPKRLAEQDEPLELNPIRESWLRDRQIAIAARNRSPGSGSARCPPRLQFGAWRVWDRAASAHRCRQLGIKTRSGGRLLPMGRIRL